LAGNFYPLTSRVVEPLANGLCVVLLSVSAPDGAQPRDEVELAVPDAVQPQVEVPDELAAPGVPELLLGVAGELAESGGPEQPLEVADALVESGAPELPLEVADELVVSGGPERRPEVADELVVSGALELPLEVADALVEWGAPELRLEVADEPVESGAPEPPLEVPAELAASGGLALPDGPAALAELPVADPAQDVGIALGRWLAEARFCSRELASPVFQVAGLVEPARALPAPLVARFASRWPADARPAPCKKLQAGGKLQARPAALGHLRQIAHDCWKLHACFEIERGLAGSADHAPRPAPGAWAAPQFHRARRCS
jgi:hypothetical protein